MKKIIAILLILTVGLTLIACGGKESADMNNATSSIDQSKCKHDWKEADCTNPETCKICALESGKPLGHEYYEGVCLKCGAELPEEEKPNLGNVIIMGDSISTFEGSSYELGQFWYKFGGRDDNMTDVFDVSQCWWDILISNSNARLLRNQSCSGSTFVEAKFKGGEFEKAYNSFWDRLNRYMLQTNFFEGKTVDTVIFFGGTNDNNQCALGEVKYEGWTDEDLKYFAPAYAHYIYQLKQICPDAKLVSIVDTTLAQVSDTMLEINEHYGVQSVVMHGFDEIAPHPTIKGMREIESVLREALIMGADQKG